MRQRGITAALAIAIALMIAPTSQAENPAPIATILCYHVVESPSDTRFAISRETFEQHLDYLEDTGYTVISLAQLYDYLKEGKEAVPENAVVITVDDGWKCTYDIFYEELSRRDMPFTAFIYPRFINKGGYALTWDQIREMSDNGVDIQSHTLSHPFLTRRYQEEREDYITWLRSELLESKRILEEKTDKPVRFLAYPYGEYDTYVANATRDMGYEAGLTCNYGPVREGDDPYRLKRVVIEKSTTFEQFRKYLGTGRLKVTDVTPRMTRRGNPAYPVVSARIIDHDALDPESIRMTILGEDSPRYFYDDRDGSVSLVLNEDIDSRVLDVVVWGNLRESGERVAAAWRIERPDPSNSMASARHSMRSTSLDQ